MLLDPGTAPQIGESDGVLDRIERAVLAAIRETDIAGWHKQKAVLGVIYAELGTAERHATVTALRTKIATVLRAALSVEEFSRARITFHCFPEDQSDGSRGLPIDELYPDLVKRHADQKVSRMIKRAMDVLGSAMALILVWPIFLGAALAIRLSSPGPILFRQRRIGQYGVAFTCLKFRSMYTGNDPRIHIEYVKRFIGGNIAADTPGTNGKVYKITKDPRLTPIGQFLRKTSLDELPQLLNVLRGEMSLVGPRPPIPYELEAYDIWHRRRLLEVKPGITGLWQVNGRSRLAFDDMVRLDLRYATTWSLCLDLKILLRTPQAVLFGEGAY
jgi:lipopolysaccharide/colanic/teichoic acid biosynthesis glycosyltransferase